MVNTMADLNYGDGISCEGNNAVIRNARYSNFSGNIIARVNGQGIGVDGCTSASVTANQIFSPSIIGINFSNCPFISITGNYLQSCGGNGIFSNAAAEGYVISGNLFNTTTYFSSSFQGEAIFINTPLGPDFCGGQIVGNWARDLAGAFCYDGANSICQGNTVINAHLSSLPTRRYTIRTDSSRSSVLNNIIRHGIGGASTHCDAAILVDDTVTVSNNEITGTFALGKYFIGRHRGSIVSQGLNADDFSHSSETQRYHFRANSAPAGSFFGPGDKFEFLSPTAGGWIGQVFTSAGWKNYGGIAA
jgi:hypothetical protein